MYPSDIEIVLCAGTSCHVMGSGEIMSMIGALSDTHRARIHLKLTHCLGACSQGPNMKINGQLYTNVTPDQARKLLAQLLAE